MDEDNTLAGVTLTPSQRLRHDVLRDRVLDRYRGIVDDVGGAGDYHDVALALTRAALLAEALGQADDHAARGGYEYGAWGLQHALDMTEEGQA